MSDEEFEPRLGHARARGGKVGRKYLGRVIAAAARAGSVTGTRKRTFDGSRIGRGAAIGSLLSTRDRHAGQRVRRAVVKTRLVRLAGKGLAGATAHLRYIQRDGVTRDGLPGELYSAEQDVADGPAFIGRSVEDRHQFRFIVSAEDGSEYADLKPLIRRLMTQAEEDLGTKLDWVAVDHFNTGHPHTHIMLRGADDQGRDLIIARAYIGRGLRERAGELVSLDLGPRTDLEIEERLRHDVTAERATSLDRRLIREIDADRIVSIADPDSFHQALRAGRLQTLGRLGLAEDLGGGHWRLADDLEGTLREISERGDIIRTMQREMTARKLDRSGADQRIYDPGDSANAPLIGRVLVRGLADEHADRHYLLVDAVDGRSYYVAVGRGDATEPTPAGSIVRIVPRAAHIREADRTIDAVARANGGHYSVDLHLRHDPTATQSYAEMHVRRLEAMRKLIDGAEREPSGRWTIAEDHLDRAVAYEARLARDRPVAIEIVSTVPLEGLCRIDAATWLDRSLVEGDDLLIRDAGFGHDVKAAQAARRQWLIEQDLVEAQGDALRLRTSLLNVLRRRELLRVGSQLSDELGNAFVEAKPGDRIDGMLTRRLDLTSGRFALVEKAHEFTLVPWKPTLDRQISQPVSGIVRDMDNGLTVNWTIGRERGPTLS